jgi:tungstate transport system ATP-binding protein
MACGITRCAGSADVDASVRLSMRGVSVHAGAVALIEAVDLDLPLSGRTVVIGPNGAGKSSLLLAMHGLLPLSCGRIEVGGDTGGDSRRRHFALVLQKPVMLRRSAAENVEHALRVAGLAGPEVRGRALAALEDVGLSYAADRPARQLSGGEQQRLSIARANALEPQCLLLDEPTSSLDPAAGAAVERYLLELSLRGRGIVMATHDLAQARRLAQRVVFMHRGRVEESTDAAAFFDRPRTDAARRFLAGDWLD